MRTAHHFFRALALAVLLIPALAIAAGDGQVSIVEIDHVQSIPIHK